VSRLGKIPIEIPSGVNVKIDGTVVSAKGPKGELQVNLIDGISVKQEGEQLVVSRDGDDRPTRARQGLIRRLVANIVEGTNTGFAKVLEINGVGYRADVKKREVHLSLGFSHPIVYTLPAGIDASVEKQTVVTVSGPDRQLVGEVAANIRKLRPPEPYKGKGIRYSDEHVRRKAGKAGGA
jgi:large subunit ribosomal protein L6